MKPHLKFLYGRWLCYGRRHGVRTTFAVSGVDPLDAFINWQSYMKISTGFYDERWIVDAQKLS